MGRRMEWKKNTGIIGIFTIVLLCKIETYDIITMIYIIII